MGIMSFSSVSLATSLSSNFLDKETTWFFCFPLFGDAAGELSELAFGWEKILEIFIGIIAGRFISGGEARLLSERDSGP